MSEYRVLCASGIDSSGSDGEFCIRVREKSSEVIPNGELVLMVHRAAEKKGVRLVGSVYEKPYEHSCDNCGTEAK